MKTIFKAVQMTKAAIELTLSFKARVTNASGTSLFAMAAADIPALGIRLISNGISGFADLIASGAAVVSGSGAVVTLANLPAGVHRLLVVAQYGTNTRSLLALDITVPGALAEGTQEIAENVIVIETIGDGAEETIVDDALSDSSTNPVQNKVVTAALSGKADAQIYAAGDNIATIGCDSMVLNQPGVDEYFSVSIGPQEVRVNLGVAGSGQSSLERPTDADELYAKAGTFGAKDSNGDMQFKVEGKTLYLYDAQGNGVTLTADELTALKALLNQ